LLAAAALVAMLVAVPAANAATFSRGSIKVDFKSLKGVKVTPKGHTAKTSTGATFTFAESAGNATLNKQASGNLNVLSTSQVTLTRGKKKIVIGSMVQKLKAGAGTLSGKIGGKGKLVDFFSQASANRIVVDSRNTTLGMQTASMTLTKAGAAALNKAFGLKGKSALKAKAKVGSTSFTANRSLTVVGGETRTVYDVAFVDQLRSCGIDLGAVAPATAIPVDETSSPRGGVVLPINATAGGRIVAATLVGTVNHLGGTVLNRDEPGTGTNQTSKPRYNSPLRDFIFGLQGPGVPTLSAFIVNLNLSTSIGTIVGGTPAAELTPDGGAVTLVGDLQLSDPASANLSQAAPPLGADCPIPSGSKIGRATMSAQVN
jgi:hypothetical protein